MLKVNAKAGNAPALQLDVNVIRMFAGTVGLGIEFFMSIWSLQLYLMSFSPFLSFSLLYVFFSF